MTKSNGVEMRNEQVIAMRHQGMTLQKIGETFGISRERVRGIIQKHKYVEQNKVARDALLAQWNSTRDLDMSVNVLDLPVRAVNALRNCRVYTIGELVQTNERVLLRSPNMGKISIAFIKSELARFNLTLAA